MHILPIEEYASRSVQGTRRASNQDRQAVVEELGLVVLADGVAGRPAGDRAAEIAVAAVLSHLGSLLGGPMLSHVGAEAVLRETFQLANWAVLRASGMNERLSNMATTLVAAIFAGGHAVIANLGDSQAYRMRRSFLKQVTSAHVVEHAGIHALHEADAHAVRPLIQRLTRAVGNLDTAEPDVCSERLLPDDLFLFCSNGLSDFVETYQMAQVILESPSLAAASERLIEAAVASGSDDDVTVVLVKPRLLGS